MCTHWPTVHTAETNRGNALFVWLGPPARELRGFRAQWNRATFPWQNLDADWSRSVKLATANPFLGRVEWSGSAVGWLCCTVCVCASDAGLWMILKSNLRMVEVSLQANQHGGWHPIRVPGVGRHNEPWALRCYGDAPSHRLRIAVLFWLISPVLLPNGRVSGWCNWNQYWWKIRNYLNV